MSLMPKFETWGRLVPIAGHPDRYVGQLGDNGADGTLVTKVVDGRVAGKAIHIAKDGTRTEYEVLTVTETEEKNPRIRSTLGIGGRPMVHVFTKPAIAAKTGRLFLAVWTQKAAGADISQEAYDLALGL